MTVTNSWAALLLLSCLTTLSSSKDSRPNILLILTDDQVNPHLLLYDTSITFATHISVTRMWSSGRCSSCRSCSGTWARRARCTGAATRPRPCAAPRAPRC